MFSPATIAVSLFIVASHHGVHKRFDVPDKGCQSATCVRRVGKRWWAKHHPRAQVAMSSAFDECVEMRESTDTNDDTGNGYYGYEQWLPSTYNTAARMAGLPERALPIEASRAEQREAFNVYEPMDPGAWPVSVPACGGP